ncbi:MAG: ATP-binding cassette domain-containing protein [Planctomycetes bacterium]|nr:ATP-binding cassette domain-containing protein [Planctomycetota bacterium]
MTPDVTVAAYEITKRFGDFTAIDKVSFEFGPGKIHGIIGPNGAGKTTTIRSLMHILIPDEGRVELLGKPVTNDTLSRVGYLPEERGLYKKMTVKAMLRFFASLKGLTNADVDPLIDVWLTNFGLDEWKNRKVESLSKGMGQKVQFLATVLHSPDVLILDEPFSGLDPVNTEFMISVIEKFRAEGKTILFSTHVMEQAEKLCDDILMIHRGKVVIRDTISAIKEQFAQNAFEVELDGDGKFLNDLDEVAEVHFAEENGGLVYDVELKEDRSSRELLGSIIAHAGVKRFERRTPSLHDIFIALVGDEAKVATR